MTGGPVQAIPETTDTENNGEPNLTVLRSIDPQKRRADVVTVAGIIEDPVGPRVVFLRCTLGALLDLGAKVGPAQIREVAVNHVEQATSAHARDREPWWPG